MANEFRGGELQNAVDTLINTHGMESLLKAMLTNLKPMEVYNERYIDNLILNIGIALENYQKRYDK